MNHDGELDLVELSSLLLKLTGRAPGHAELELSLRELDSDASGTVSLDELLSWWARKKTEETLAVHEAVVSEAPAPAPKQVPPSPAPVQAAKPHSGYQLLSDARNLAASSAETFRKLRSWAVGTGPMSVRVLSFFAGVLLCVCAVLCAVIGDVFRCEAFCDRSVLRPKNLFDALETANCC